MNKKGHAAIIVAAVALVGLAGLMMTVGSNGPTGAVTVPEYIQTPCSQTNSICGGVPHPITERALVTRAVLDGDFIVTNDGTSPTGICIEECRGGLPTCDPVATCIDAVQTCISCNPNTDPGCGTDGACWDCGNDGMCN